MQFVEVGSGSAWSHLSRVWSMVLFGNTDTNLEWSCVPGKLAHLAGTKTQQILIMAIREITNPLDRDCSTHLTESRQFFRARLPGIPCRLAEKNVVGTPRILP